MIKIAICDDEPVHLKLAEKLVKDSLGPKKVNYAIRLFQDTETFLSEIETSEYQPDIAVLDIDFNGEKGIGTAGKINELLPSCRIIFLTGYITYASDVYKTEHVWFVYKNSAEKHFPAAMNKALSELENQDTRSSALVIRQNNISVVVPVKRILYISKVHRKAYIRCTDSEYSDTRRPALLIPEHLKQHFIQCHQGYWVNIEMIRELDHDEFILPNNIRIPISRTFRDSARKQFFDYYRGVEN